MLIVPPSFRSRGTSIFAEATAWQASDDRRRHACRYRERRE